LIGGLYCSLDGLPLRAPAEKVGLDAPEAEPDASAEDGDECEGE
jgi:hypothetical protein